MSFFKEKRIVDQKLIQRLQKKPCVVCGSDNGLNDVHHVTTRGAGGGDTKSNCITLCRTHHQMWHHLGACYMAKTFERVTIWLQQNNRSDILSRIEKVMH